MRVLQLVVRTYHGPTVKLLDRFWQETEPDMVVSLVPHFNRALRESFDKAFPGRPFVTVLTDLADYPKHFWIESQPQYLVCGTERAVEQARELGHLDGTVFQTSGMILHPRFYEPEPADRIAEEKKARPRSGSSDRHRAVRRIRDLEDAAHPAADRQFLTLPCS